MLTRLWNIPLRGLLFGDHVVADIPITAQTRTTLVALRQARTLIDASSKRITTGLRVSSPFDGVSAFFDAQDLSARTVNLLKAKERLIKEFLSNLQKQYLNFFYSEHAIF